MVNDDNLLTIIKSVMHHYPLPPAVYIYEYGSGLHRYVHISVL